mmetsp:Transcript_21466/g.54868  ORF Transcript_21466/g.54868 Transcript_21466/m.54868 type:complete len:230 (-) Transcript_21466:9-698(-)
MLAKFLSRMVGTAVCRCLIPRACICGNLARGDSRKASLTGRWVSRFSIPGLAMSLCRTRAAGFTSSSSPARSFGFSEKRAGRTACSAFPALWRLMMRIPSSCATGTTAECRCWMPTAGSSTSGEGTRRSPPRARSRPRTRGTSPRRWSGSASAPPAALRFAGTGWWPWRTPCSMRCSYTELAGCNPSRPSSSFSSGLTLRALAWVGPIVFFPPVPLLGNLPCGGPFFLW